MPTIKPIPDIPDALIQAAELGNLVPFVGAGVSRLAGGVTWAQLASSAIDALVKEKALSPLQRSQLSHLNPRLKLSLAEITARKEGIAIPYKSILQPAQWSEHKEGRRIYTRLTSIARHFVTTNYDEWLDIELPVPGAPTTTPANDDTVPTTARQRFFLPSQMDPARLCRSDCVMHLHGSVTDPASMVLTTNDYIKLYAADRHRIGGEGENPVLSFLTFLFEARNVLFIGYGLEELEIIEYVVFKSRSKKEHAPETKHFILQGFYSVEADLCNALTQYYKEWGITLIPFSLDEADWPQLIEVIDHLASIVPTAQEPALAVRANMQRLLRG